MIFDAANIFSYQQAVTATAASQNVIKVAENLGVGEPVFASVHVVEPFVGLTSLNVELQSGDSDQGPFTVIAQTGVVPLAELQNGKVMRFGSVPQRTGEYLRLNYVVAGTATAGKITAGLVLDTQTNNKI